MIIEAQYPLYYDDNIVQEVADIMALNKEMPVITSNLYDQKSFQD